MNCQIFCHINSIRSLIICTRELSPSSVVIVFKILVFFLVASTSVTIDPGSDIAMAIPGNPQPVPTSMQLRNS